MPTTFYAEDLPNRPACLTSLHNPALDDPAFLAASLARSAWFHGAARTAKRTLPLSALPRLHVLSFRAPSPESFIDFLGRLRGAQVAAAGEDGGYTRVLLRVTSKRLLTRSLSALALRTGVNWILLPTPTSAPTRARVGSGAAPTHSAALR